MRLFTIAAFFLFPYSCIQGQESYYAQSHGVEIHYITIGEGTPVLIINGGPGFNSKGFMPLAKEIASLGYTAILYDQRGTGSSTLSEVNSNTVTMDLMNADIEAIRQDLNIEKWVVFGHSFGGMMAYYYASHYPERIAAMIQSSSGGIDLAILNNTQNRMREMLSAQDYDSLQYWRDRRDESAGADTRYLHYLAKAYVYDDDHVETVAERLVEGDLELNSLVWQNMASIDFDCKEAMKNFDQPVLIIQGENEIVSKELAIEADKVLPDSKLIFLENCGHYGWLDQREHYFSHLARFLKESTSY